MRRDLVEKARAGDRAAFAELAAQSIGRLFNTVLVAGGSKDTGALASCELYSADAP